MRKHDFIEALAAKANITTEQAAQVNEILEAHSIIGKNAKKAVVEEIAQALSVDMETADNISNDASSIVMTALKNKLRHPFGSDK